MTRFQALGVCLVFGALAWFGAQRTEIPTPKVAPAETITVSVFGAVAHPGKVQLHAGETFSDALQKAGGPIPEAKLSSVALLRDDAAAGRKVRKLDLRRPFLYPLPRNGDALLIPEAIALR